MWKLMITRRVALLGTMATEWRKNAREVVVASGCEVLDNTDERWASANSAEEIAPLLANDLRQMRSADVVLWHHDSHTEGRTARIELGFLAGASIVTIVHAEVEGVASLAYIEALCSLHATLHWCPGPLEKAASLAVSVALQRNDGER